MFRKGKRSQIKICRAPRVCKKIFFSAIYFYRHPEREIYGDRTFGRNARVSQIGSEDARRPRIDNNRTTKAHFFFFFFLLLLIHSILCYGMLYTYARKINFLLSIITSILHRRDSLSCIGGRQEQRAIDKYTINLSLYT